MNKVKTRGWLGQPSIIKSLEQKFGERAMKERLSLTPGTPRFTARSLQNPEDKVNPEEHESYRSGVGTLLYLTSGRTKHIDIRTSFVKEYQEDGKIIIKFVQSEDNEADISTKNTTNTIFQNHQNKFLGDEGEVNKEGSQELTQK